LERDEASGIEAQRLARCEIARHDRSAGVDEREALAFELLQDEALAAEQAGTDLLVPRDADGDALRGAQKRVLLTQQRAAVRAQIDRDDLARVRRGERHLLTCR